MGCVEKGRFFVVQKSSLEKYIHKKLNHNFHSLSRSLLDSFSHLPNDSFLELVGNKYVQQVLGFNSLRKFIWLKTWLSDNESTLGNHSKSQLWVRERNICFLSLSHDWVMSKIYKYERMVINNYSKKMYNKFKALIGQRPFLSA